MAIYAEINNAIVVNVIIADADFIKSLPNKTAYKVLKRGGIGWTFDGTNFIAPQPFESWTLDDANDWQPPKPMPTDGVNYYWDETSKDWKEYDEQKN